jgi:hypothetical protein
MPEAARKLVSRLILIFLLVLSCAYADQKTSIPTFGRDTVLVWRSENQGLVSDFVVRIAEFLPDRFIEWEDATTQGTILMTNRAVMAGKGFVNASLFKAGGDAKGGDTTTLWLSQQTYRDLKEKKRLKLTIDSIESRITNEGEGEITLEVNGVPMALPVIRVRDERGSERWFLDRIDNPLLAKHIIRKYTQTLVSITTDRANTLRWIKGKKLPNSP